MNGGKKMMAKGKEMMVNGNGAFDVCQAEYWERTPGGAVACRLCPPRLHAGRRAARAVPQPREQWRAAGERSLRAGVRLGRGPGGEEAAAALPSGRAVPLAGRRRVQPRLPLVPEPLHIAGCRGRCAVAEARARRRGAAGRRGGVPHGGLHLHRTAHLH